MHYRLLVTISLANNATSEEARHAVYDTLITDNNFCGEGGRFGSPLCDWFVIGGRWSGLLAETLLGQKYKTAVTLLDASFAEEPGTAETEERQRKALDALWCKHGGTWLRPETRGSYEELGCADDAAILNTTLYEALLSDYHARGIHGNCEEYADLDGEALHPNFVGRKWLVVVDYHN